MEAPSSSANPSSSTDWPSAAPMFPPGSQRERMLAGLPYHQGRDVELLAARRKARQLLETLNATSVLDREARLPILKELFGKIDEASPPWIERGFNVDFGCNTTWGTDVFANYNLTILDCGRVTIGSRVLMGPNVQLLGATHPLHPDLRRGTEGPEFGASVTIEDDVWLGAGCMILPGVTVGRGSVVGAGAVVTREVEPMTVVAGNPARVLRRLPPNPTPEEKAAHTVVC